MRTAAELRPERWQSHLAAGFPSTWNRGPPSPPRFAGGVGSARPRASARAILVENDAAATQIGHQRRQLSESRLSEISVPSSPGPWTARPWHRARPRAPCARRQSPCGRRRWPFARRPPPSSRWRACPSRRPSRRLPGRRPLGVVQHAAELLAGRLEIFRGGVRLATLSWRFLNIAGVSISVFTRVIVPFRLATVARRSPTSLPPSASRSSMPEAREPHDLARLEIPALLPARRNDIHETVAHQPAAADDDPRVAGDAKRLDWMRTDPRRAHGRPVRLPIPCRSARRPSAPSSWSRPLALGSSTVSGYDLA